MSRINRITRRRRLNRSLSRTAFERKFSPSSIFNYSDVLAEIKYNKGLDEDETEDASQLIYGLELEDCQNLVSKFNSEHGTHLNIRRNSLNKLTDSITTMTLIAKNELGETMHPKLKGLIASGHLFVANRWSHIDNIMFKGGNLNNGQSAS